MPDSQAPRFAHDEAVTPADAKTTIMHSLDRRTFFGTAGAAVIGTALLGHAGAAAAVPAPRLLVDRMLSRTARWLRAAGYDTALAAGQMRRRGLMREAVGADRILISTDRGLAALTDASGHLMLVARASLPVTAAELTARLGINWLYDPFSRCIVCNRPVEAVSPATGWQAPVTTSAQLAEVQPLTRCAGCDQTYWRGGHVRRMQTRLEDWQAGRFI